MKREISSSININFIPNWEPFDKLERKVRVAVQSTFSKFVWQPTHNPLDVHSIHPSMRETDVLLGLAYTSTSDYAALWICNAGTLWADEDHWFRGYTINTDGDVIGIAWDANENEIYINLSKGIL